MINQSDMFERARASARLLKKLNIFTLFVAFCTYFGLLTIAIIQRVGPLAVFSSCVMLAELLVFQIVRTLINHFELLRWRSASGE